MKREFTSFLSAIRIIGRTVHPGVFLAAFLVCLFQVCSFDTFFYMRMGELICKEGHWLQSNRFSWVCPDVPYTPTAWLFQVLVYLAHAVAGPVGLVLLRALLVGVTWGLLAGHFARKGVSGWILLPVFVAAIDISLFRFLVRPQLLSFLGLSLLVLLVARLVRNPSDRHLLWQFPLLFCLWANFHSGVIFGFIFLGVSLVGEFIDKQEWNIPKSPFCRYGAAIVVLSVLASLVNPQGWDLYGYIYRHLTMDSVIEIGELEPFRPLRHLKVTFVLAWLAVLPLIVMAAGRRLRVTPALLAVTGLCLLSKGVRFIPLTCLFCIPGIFAAVDLIAQQHAGKRSSFSFLARMKSANVLLCVLLPLLYAVHVHANVFTMEKNIFRTGLGFNRRVFAFEALPFMPDKLEKGLYNSFSMGGFLIWQSKDNVRVFQDGRVDPYPPSFFRKIERLRMSRQGCSELLTTYDISHVLVRFEEDTPMATTIMDNQRWKVCYQDDRFLYAERLK